MAETHETRIPRRARVVGVVALMFLLAASLSFAANGPWTEKDSFYMEEQIVTKAPVGTKAPGGMIKTWVSGPKMRTEASSGEIVIYRVDLGVAWLLHAPSKTYVEVTSEQLAQMGMQSIAAYGRYQNGELSIPDPLFRDTGETHMVNSWTCRNMDVLAAQSLGPGVATRTTQCVAAKFPLGVEDLIHVFSLSIGGATNDSIEHFYKQIRTLPGYPVEQRTVTTADLQTIETTKTVMKVERKPISASTFDLPKDFTKIAQPGAPKRP